LLLASCGDGDSNLSAQSKADIESSMPMYYEVIKVVGKGTETKAFDKDVVITQFAVDVKLKEDVYRNERDREEYLSLLVKGGVFKNYEASAVLSKKGIITKVGSKGESVTLYGEIVHEVKVGGNSNMLHFKLDGPEGKALSAFDRSQVLISGSKEMEEYLSSKRQEKQEQNNAAAAKKIADVKAKSEKAAAALKAKTEKEAALQAAIDQKSEEMQQKFAKFFTVGNTYEGVYKHSRSEKLKLEVLEYDEKLLFGLLRVSSTERPDLVMNMKISISKKVGRNKEVEYSVVGTQTKKIEVDRDTQKESRFAKTAGSFGLKLISLSFGEDSVVFRLNYDFMEFVYSSE